MSYNYSQTILAGLLVCLETRLTVLPCLTKRAVRELLVLAGTNPTAFMNSLTPAELALLPAALNLLTPVQLDLFDAPLTEDS